MIREPLMTVVGNFGKMSLSVLCMSGYLLLAACGGGGGGTSSAVAVLPANSSPIGTETVEAAPVVGASVTTCGDITSSGAYVLQNDVSSDGTCFTIKAPNVVLNLNGHTVTYDNRAPISVPNGDFESVLSGTWDTTYAPNAARAAGTYIQPVSLYSGNYALRFALPFTGPQYVRSQQVTLAANTTYSISAMFRNSGNNDAANPYSGGVRDSLTMKIELEGTSGSATQTGVTWRGFQFTYFTYTTGASPENHIIRITVDNVNAAATGYAYVDDIKILKTPSYGVNISPVYEGANYARVTNGTIIQGQGGGFASHAIRIGESAGTGWSIDNLTLTTHGVNSKILNSYRMQGATFNNNVINHNVTTIISRDNYDGAAFFVPYAGAAGTVYNNTFNTGIQTAIYAKTADSGQHQIYGNNISLQTKYTNDFAIAAAGSEVYSNIVNCVGANNSCRGIWIGGTNTKVYNNTVSVQQLVRNQEYNGCEASGAYGMQAEGATVGSEVYGNTVTAITGDGVCEASALRLGPTLSGSIDVHDNTFTASRTGTGRATTMMFFGTIYPSATITGNAFITNHRWIYLNGGGAVTGVLTGNKFETAGTLPSPFYPFEVYVGYASGSFTFVDNLYGTGDQARFEDEYFRTSSGTIDSGSSITVTP